MGQSKAQLQDPLGLLKPNSSEHHHHTPNPTKKVSSISINAPAQAEDQSNNTDADDNDPGNEITGHYKSSRLPSTKMARVKRLALISPEDLQTPTIAVPTIAVSLGSLAAWASILYFGAYKRKVSALVTFPFMTAACFASFTPVHDATHSSIAKGSLKKPMRELVGYLTGVPLIIPFGVYRQLHLLHHRYTNTDDDPDVWDSRGPMVFRFFKWFVPDYFWIVDALKGRGTPDKIMEAGLFYICVAVIIKRMRMLNMNVVKYWILPQRFAYWLLMWLFAYVPHKPHKFRAGDNVYKTTSVTGGILNSNGFNLAIPLLNQHLHNIHHLYPHLPFSRYGKIWAKHKDALLAAGTEVHPVYSRDVGWHWNPEV